MKGMQILTDAFDKAEKAKRANRRGDVDAERRWLKEHIEMLDQLIAEATTEKTVAVAQRARRHAQQQMDGLGAPGGS